MPKQEEELPRNTSIVKSFLRVHLDHEPLLELDCGEIHDGLVRRLKDVFTRDLKRDGTGKRPHLGLAAEVDNLREGGREEERRGHNGGLSSRRQQEKGLGRTLRRNVIWYAGVLASTEPGILGSSHVVVLVEWSTK